MGKIDSFSGSTTHRVTVSESVAYINQVYKDFVDYAKLTPELIRNRRLLELGPGDNVGVTLRFIAAGAREARCLDKFYSTHEIEHERQIYLELRKHLNDEEKRNFDMVVSLEDGVKLNEKKLRYIYGYGAQDADKPLAGELFDIIISRGVLQEVHRTDAAFAALDKLLAPGGVMAHKIDLRDYGMFSGIGFHPREFLTIPEYIYWLMAYDSDKPNRNMLDYYRSKMKELGYDAQLYITSIIEQQGYRGIQKEIIPHKTKLDFGVDYFEEERQRVAEIRPRLASRFRNLSEEDLLAAGVFIVAKKPLTK